VSQACGEIDTLKLATDAAGKFRGFGHATFHTPAAAAAAAALHGSLKIGGRDIKVGAAPPGPLEPYDTGDQVHQAPLEP
jgi:RNA recognition motif-containing protein